MICFSAGINLHQAILIQAFVTTGQTVIDFLNSSHKSDNLPNGIVEITEDELKRNQDAYNHEMTHKKAWNKYGICVGFVKIGNDQYATVTKNLEIVAKDFTKDHLINVLKDAYIAPYASGIRHKVYGDLLVYEILNKTAPNNIKVENEHEIIEWIKNKYPQLTD